MCEVEADGLVTAKQLGMSLSGAQLCLGGVVADTVGMGKTAQIIARMLARPRQSDAKPTSKLPFDYQGNNLVVTPGHLCRQWQGEIHRCVLRS